MNLDEAQKQRVREWIDDGLKLSEIQSKLDSEMQMRLTYMELRFLIDDLSLKPRDPEPVKDPAADPQTPGAKDNVGANLGDSAGPESEPKGGTGVSVTVDRVTRPGSVISGRARFSDGVSAEWYLDQMGRLGLVPETPGYKPSQADVMDFQSQLQRELGKQGF
ncbi:MAG: hypothetical protein O2960_18255 [Verrucomicrobia bacterium]|nr:hypothetical protein [Verrucomicrobiota bacterium]